jgi:ribonuclease HI
MKLTIHTDGGARGNPGIAGGGMVVLDEKRQEFHAESFPFGTKTNNEAEYLAVLRALEWLQSYTGKQPIESVQFVLDSKLVVEQLDKQWKIKEPRLKTLAQQCWNIMGKLPYSLQFSHVKRHANVRADLLANEAMDAIQ